MQHKKHVCTTHVFAYFFEHFERTLQIGYPGRYIYIYRYSHGEMYFTFYNILYCFQTAIHQPGNLSRLINTIRLMTPVRISGDLIIILLACGLRSRFTRM